MKYILSILILSANTYACELPKLDHNLLSKNCYIKPLSGDESTTKGEELNGLNSYKSINKNKGMSNNCYSGHKNSCPQKWSEMRLPERL
ncbi:hypothetical protein [Halobacteriovorax sp.]|uniref:hypothetical protein n=1 Tax=Halobacteriovorax sp. TaxID=2020862 RepID=UPI0035662C72